MKRSLFIIILIIIVISIIFNINNQKNNNTLKYSSNYTAEKTSTSSDEFNINYISNEVTTSEKSNDNSVEENRKEKDKKDNNEHKAVSDFSTKLPKDTKARYSNIDLACETLDNTIVKSGETFSLWNTLGCPTKEKGYKKAKAFTSDGKIKYSYGGGICQVSTTIYNALLKVDGIKILERHEHSRDVTYVKDGKDAAVSYKSADLKFKNNLEYDIRLKAKVNNNKVIIEIEKV